MFAELSRRVAIATPRYCDYFAPFHYARNDKICFYTFGILPNVTTADYYFLISCIFLTTLLTMFLGANLTDLANILFLKPGITIVLFAIKPS